MGHRWAWGMIVLALGANPARAQVSFEAFSGTAFSLHTPLTISQRGQPDIRLTAHYDTRPLEDTWYYGGRVALWKKDRAWVLTLIHHKLYLENPTVDVESFRITYGFNMATLGAAWRRDHLIYTVGAGVVVTHAASTVRGVYYSDSGGLFNKGYAVTGVTANGSAQYQWHMAKFLYLVGETLVSASYVSVQVAEGKASVPQASLHLHAGLGFSF
jgi:hypothetical protein